jgi:hypothetical protein
MTKHPLRVIAVVLFASMTVSAAAQHPAMPPGMTHEEHLKQMQKDAELERRGRAAMGFDQEKTTHHFRLTPNGGAIDVIVNDPSDAASLVQVRAHLTDIAAEFAMGGFEKPLATHGEQPPGVATLHARRSTITYEYRDLPNGGRVAIETKDSRARRAVHDFLRYQIREHATGDPTIVRPLSSD